MAEKFENMRFIIGLLDKKLFPGDPRGKILIFRGSPIPGDKNFPGELRPLHVAFFREILKSRVFLTIHAILESKVTLKGNFKRHEEVFDALRQLKARSRNLLAESKLIMHK